MMMISVHSSGQPSRKMIAWAMMHEAERVRVEAQDELLDDACPPR